MSEGLKEVRQVTKDNFVVHVDQRERFLSEPVVRPESFGDAKYLHNLGEIYKLVTENGQPYFNSKEDSFLFMAFGNGVASYRGQVGEEKLFDGRKRGYVLVREYLLGNSSSNDNNIRFFDDGTVEGSFTRSDGARIWLDRTICGNFDSKTVAFLDDFTSVFLKKMSSSTNQGRVSPDFYKQNPTTGQMVENIDRLRGIEKGMIDGVGYITDRGAERYLIDLYGLDGTLRYASSLGEKMRVLDIGTGKGKAWSEFSKKYGDILDFWATSLIYDKHLVDLFGEKVRFTPVESMVDFDNESIGGIVALNSIAYGFPEMAVKEIDRVLVSGGIIKASFRKPNSSDLVEHGFQDHERFTNQLLNLNYDVAISPDDRVILAIKPGGKERAIDVFRKDRESLKQNPS